MVHESIEFKQQLFATGSVGTSFQPCDHHSDGLLPPQRCVKKSSCPASSHLSIQTCSKLQLAGRLARAVNCVSPHIYPGALTNPNWEPVNISLRQSLCDALRQLEGSFSSVVLWEWAQPSDRSQHRAEQCCNPAERQGWELEEWPWKGTALPVWKSLFFPCSVSRQAGMAPRKKFHQCTWFSTNLVSIAKLRWEKEAMGGQGSTKPHCGCSLLLTRAPPKHS